jgi:hypothetical protein
VARQRGVQIDGFRAHAPTTAIQLTTPFDAATSACSPSDSVVKSPSVSRAAFERSVTEGKIQLLDLGPQTTDHIVDPADHKGKCFDIARTGAHDGS